MENKKMMEDRLALMQRKAKILRLNTQEERDFQCALWSLEYLRDYEKKPFPAKPEKVIKYHNTDKSNQEKMERNPSDYDDFWRDSEVMKYFEDVAFIKSVNKNNYEWLLFIKKILKDKKDVSGIEKTIATHEGGERVEWSD